MANQKFNAIETNKDVGNDNDCDDGSGNNSDVDESRNISTHQNHNPNQMSLICSFFFCVLKIHSLVLTTLLLCTMCVTRFSYTRAHTSIEEPKCSMEFILIQRT